MPQVGRGDPSRRARARAAQHSRPRRTVSTCQCHTPVRPPTLDCAVRLRLRRTHVLCRLRLGSCARNSAVPPLARMDGRRDSRRTGCTGGFAATYSALRRRGCGAGGRSGSASRRSQRQRPTSHATCNMQHATCNMHPLRVGGSRRLGLRHTRLRLPCAALCAVLHLACRTAAPSVAHRKLELAARIVASHMAPRRTPCSTRTRHCGVTSCEAHAAWRVRRVSERRG